MQDNAEITNEIDYNIELKSQKKKMKEISDENQNEKSIGKGSLMTKLNNLNLSQEISKEKAKKRCKEKHDNSNITNTFNSIKKIKRGISKDTYNYYGNKNAKKTNDIKIYYSKPIHENIN